MQDDSTRSTSTVTRRTALAGLAAGGIGVALAATTRSASAQEDTPASYAGHPLVGTWMAMTPFGASPETFSADGSFAGGPPIIEPGQGGVLYLGPAIGVWASTGERTGSATFVQALGDATGAYTGTLTIDAHLVVSDDGQSFVDDSPQTTITIRDASNTVLQVIHPYETGATTPPVTGRRMVVGDPGLPPATPAAATPTA